MSGACTLQKLKPELKSRGLDTSGKKADLVERLEAYLKSNTAEAKEPAQAGPASSAGDADDAKPASAQVPVMHAPLCKNGLTFVLVLCFLNMHN